MQLNFLKMLKLINLVEHMNLLVTDNLLHQTLTSADDMSSSFQDNFAGCRLFCQNGGLFWTLSEDKGTTASLIFRHHFCRIYCAIVVVY